MTVSELFNQLAFLDGELEVVAWGDNGRMESVSFVEVGVETYDRFFAGVHIGQRTATVAVLV